ncbi:MAG: GNAT family N-acetyltransferase [Anaerolineae bacterium]|nr:GNAT family N-acetyltransferase [Anaerolineae bacterium]MDW8102099.1 GNAT family N-acetyltransferase [Anaerolineae bacterium]
MEIESLSKEEFKRLREELVKIYLEGYQGLEMYAYREPWMVRRYLNWLYKGDPSGFFVVKEEGKVVGFVSAHSRWFWGKEIVGEIHELVISPAYRRRGLGTALLSHIIKFLRSKKRKRIGLWVGKENKPAKRLYRKFGFRPSDTYDVWERWVLDETNPEKSEE